MGSRPFRLRSLLNPFYLAERARGIRSWDDLRSRLADLGRYIEGRARHAWHELHGAGPWLASRAHHAFFAAFAAVPWTLARAQRGYYALRGAGPWLASRAHHAYHALRALASAGARPAPAPPASPSRAEIPPPLKARRRELAAEFQAARPFKHLVIDGFFHPAFCERLCAEFPPYDDARFRNEHNHRGKAHHERIAKLGPAFAELDAFFRSKDFLGFVSELTGIPDLLFDPEYFGGGTHENLEDMELDPHVDFTLHPNGLYRRVNLLFYLNREWDDAWGGALELHVNPWRPSEQSRPKLVSPSFNRMVIFETSDRSWHGFQRIRLPAGRECVSRKSVALYLYTREDPRGILAIPPDLTVFVDRPLPAHLRPGHTLTDEDMRALGHLIRRRDWKLEYLYGRAIGLFNQWREAAGKTGARAGRGAA